MLRNRAPQRNAQGWGRSQGDGGGVREAGAEPWVNGVESGEDEGHRLVERVTRKFRPFWSKALSSPSREFNTRLEYRCVKLEKRFSLMSKQSPVRFSEARPVPVRAPAPHTRLLLFTRTFLSTINLRRRSGLRGQPWVTVKERDGALYPLLQLCSFRTR